MGVTFLDPEEHPLSTLQEEVLRSMQFEPERAWCTLADLHRVSRAPSQVGRHRAVRNAMKALSRRGLVVYGEPNHGPGAFRITDRGELWVREHAR